MVVEVMAEKDGRYWIWSDLKQGMHEIFIHECVRMFKTPEEAVKHKLDEINLMINSLQRNKLELKDILKDKNI